MTTNEILKTINNYLANENDSFFKKLLEDIAEAHMRYEDKEQETIAKYYSSDNTINPDAGYTIDTIQIKELLDIKECLNQIPLKSYQKVSYRIRRALDDYNAWYGLDDMFYDECILKGNAMPTERKRFANKVDTFLKNFTRLQASEDREHIRVALLQESKYYQMIELISEFKEELLREDYDDIYEMNSLTTTDNFGIPPFLFNRPKSDKKEVIRDILHQIRKDYNLQQGCSEKINMFLREQNVQ